MVGLLPGEDMDGADAQDARHWIAIYAELAAFMDDMVAKTAPKTGGPSAQPPLPNPDRDALLREQQRMHERLAFWHTRHFQLVGLERDPIKHSIGYKDKTIFLTRREYQLLAFLLEHPKRSFTADQLIALAWKREDLAPEEVRTYIGRIRRRLGELGANLHLTTKPHLGYSLEFAAV